MALNDVPLSGQSLGVTRAPIRSNFLTIDAAFLQDHVDYNLPNQGMHNRVSFLNQTILPLPVASVPQMLSITSSLTGQPELNYLRQLGSTAPGVVRQVEFTSAGWANPGWSVSPSGILMKWHTGIGFVANTETVNLNVDVPGSPLYTTIFSVYITTTDSVGTYNNVIGIKTLVGPNLTVADFSGAIPPGTVTFSYLIIGM